ncbi:hypothetical protein [Nocardia farcinica]|uniref:hypothetical protein n=1 Tax=Nocardia farcinica TaxID=37329 RepID=UPI001E5446A1|nr:hypothetical protein [Nocardia farcinica]
MAVANYLRAHAELVEQIRQGRSEWRYLSIYHLLLRHGRSFIPAQRPSSVTKLPERHCFHNAARTAAARPGLVYAEGFAGAVVGSSVVPIQHAWCVWPDGTVLDPTWDQPGAAYVGVAVQARLLWPDHRRDGLLADFQRSLPLLQHGIPEAALIELGDPLTPETATELH